MDNNEVFYIGKGQGNRAFSIKGRNDKWNKICAEAGGRTVNILFTCSEEEVTLAYETFLIKTATIWGDTLANKTHGGEGRSGKVISEAVKDKLRKINTGKHHTQETIDKINKLHKDRTFVNKHKQATIEGSNTPEAKLKHKEKQRGQFKPVVGTNMMTGEKVYLEFSSQDKRFNPSLIRKCCLGKRRQHKGYTWRYT
jgi:hypothetical protein